MARTSTTLEKTVLGERSRLISPVRVEVMDTALAWQPLHNLTIGAGSGLNFFKQATWGTNVDAPTWTGTVQLAESIRKAGVEYSIAPDVLTSPINSPDPLLDGMRRIRWFGTTKRLDGTAGTEHKQFDGYIVDLEQQDGIALTVSDLGHLLVQTQIEDTRVYGSDAGELIQTVIQQILDDNMGVGVVTLVVDASITSVPATKVKKFAQDRVRVMEAIRGLALNTIGACVRYMWNGEDMELRLFMPPRAKVTADFTFTADNYEPKPKWARKTDDVRNVGRLYFQDTNNKTVAFVEASVPASVTRYGRRYFEFREIATKNIDSTPEGQRMIDAAVADLAFPKAEKAFTTQFAWPFEPWDLFTMTANGRQYTTDQPQYVTAVTHTLGTAGATRSSFDTRGTIAGFFNNWLVQEGKGATPPDDDSLFVQSGYFGEGTMYGGELFSEIGGIGEPNGCIWVFCFVGKDIRRIHGWARNNAPGTLVPDWPPTSANMYKAFTIERPEGDRALGNFVWPGGAEPMEGDPYVGINFWRTIIPVPTGRNNDGTIRTIIIMPETWDGSFGEEVRISAAAIDDANPDPGGFTSLTVTRIDPTTVRVVASTAPDSPGSGIFIFRDGVNIDSFNQPGGSGGPFTWDDTGLKAQKQYRYSIFRIRNAHSGERTQFTIDPWGTAFSFAAGTPTLSMAFPGPRVVIDVAGVPAGTDKIEVQKSKDSGQYDPWTTAARLNVSDFPFLDAVAKAGQYYKLVAFDTGNVVVGSTLPVFWRSPLPLATR